MSGWQSNHSGLKDVPGNMKPGLSSVPSAQIHSLNDCDKLKISTMMLILGMLSSRVYIFSAASLLPTTPLASLLIHVTCFQWEYHVIQQAL